MVLPPSSACVRLCIKAAGIIRSLVWGPRSQCFPAVSLLCAHNLMVTIQGWPRLLLRCMNVSGCAYAQAADMSCMLAQAWSGKLTGMSSKTLHITADYLAGPADIAALLGQQEVIPLISSQTALSHK